MSYFTLLITIFAVFCAFTTDAKITKPIKYEVLDADFNEDSRLVLMALLIIAQNKPEWASIANEQLLDLPKHTNNEIKVMYQKFLNTGILKLSIPSCKIKELGKYRFFKFDLNELKVKGTQSKVTFMNN